MCCVIEQDIEDSGDIIAKGAVVEQSDPIDPCLPISDVSNTQVRDGCVIFQHTISEGMFSPFAHVRTNTHAFKSRAWLAVRVSLRLARLPYPSKARRSRRLRSTLAAALVLLRMLLLDAIWRILTLTGGSVRVAQLVSAPLALN